MQLHCYVGDGVAHRVTKAYVGVNGIARKILDPIPLGGVKKYGTTSLPTAAASVLKNKVGNYIIFGGGITSPYNVEYSNLTKAYNKNITATSITDLSSSINTRSISIDNETFLDYALFPNGDYYSSSLVKSTLSSGLPSYFLSSVGNYMISANINNAKAYNTELVSQSVSKLSGSRTSNIATLNINNYAIFGGGIYSSGSQLRGDTYLDYYNENLVKSSNSNWKLQSSGYCGGNTYGVIAGSLNNSSTGYADSTYGYALNLLYIINSNLTSTSKSTNYYRGLGAAAQVNNYTVITGGTQGTDTYNNILNHNETELVNPNYVINIIDSISTGRFYITGASHGDYFLFAGGQTGNNTVYKTIDTYQYYVTGYN